MPRYKFYSIVQNSSGDTVSNAEVSIYISETNTPAIIYLTKNAIEPVTQPPQLVTNIDGRIEFWVDSTDYLPSTRFRIEVVKDNFSAIVDDVKIVEEEHLDPTIPDGSITPEKLSFSVTIESFQILTPDASGNVVWDLSQGTVAMLTLTRDIFLLNPTNMKSGGRYTLILEQDSVGNRIVDFDSNYRIDRQLINTNPNKVTVLNFVSDGTLMFHSGKSDVAPVSGRGYAMGGWQGSSYVNEIDGIQFIDESAIDPTASLSVARDSAAGVNSDVRGYAMGGFTESNEITAEIDGIQFSDETAINPAAVLSVARDSTAGVNSSIRGYAMGGFTESDEITAEIDGIQFSDETAINPAAGLSVARMSVAGVNSSIRGYAMGGWMDFGRTTEIDGIQFSDETAINPTAELSVARWGPTGVNSFSRGYAMGGHARFVGRTTEIDGIQFSNEIAINPTAELSVARNGAAGVNSRIRGYAMGGYAVSIGYTTEIDGIQFSNETAINPAVGLSVARYGVTGVQSGGCL